MATRLFFIGIFLIISASAFSQENPVLDSKIKAYTKKIDSTVNAEKISMNKELDDLDLRFKRGAVSDSEKQNLRKEIAGKYEKIINEKVAEESSRFEDITKQTVKNAVLKTEDKKKNYFNNSRALLTITLPDDEDKKPKYFLKNNEFIYTIFSSNLTDKEDPLNFFNEKSGVRGFSPYIGLYYRGERQLGKYDSPFFYRFGFGLNMVSFGFKKPNVLHQNNGTLQFENFTGGELKSSRLNLMYFEIPLDVQFVLNPKYIEDGGERYLDNTQKQFRIGFGMYGGLNIVKQNNINYSTTELKKNTLAESFDRGINRFVVGAKVNFGYGPIQIFVKKDFTPVFNNDAKIPAKYGMYYGLDFINYIF